VIGIGEVQRQGPEIEATLGLYLLIRQPPAVGSEGIRNDKVRGMKSLVRLSSTIAANPDQAAVAINGEPEHEILAIRRPNRYCRATRERQPAGCFPFRIVNIDIRTIADVS